MRKQPDYRSECPIAFGLDLFGDKWTLLVLRDLLFYGITRFSDFAVRERIATNILSERLIRLEDAGLISKEKDDETRNQNIYHVTEKGYSLLPTLIELSLWGMQNGAPTPLGVNFQNRLATEREQVVAELAEAVKSGTFNEYRERVMGVVLEP